jgi:DNA-directed RNA polymerase specialized sigma24 family protein
VTLPPFQSLLDAHDREVHRFLTAIVGPVDADDCYQDTWIAALKAYPDLRDASNLRGWLLTIAHNKAIDSVRSRGRAPLPTADSALFDGAVQAAPGGGVGEIWELVRRLPEKQRMALTMRYVLDADYALIAATMGTREDAARRNVHEALKQLRAKYEQPRSTGNE